MLIEPFTCRSNHTCTCTWRSLAIHVHVHVQGLHVTLTIVIWWGLLLVGVLAGVFHWIVNLCFRVHFKIRRPVITDFLQVCRYKTVCIQFVMSGSFICEHFHGFYWYRTLNLLSRCGRQNHENCELTSLHSS